MITTKTDSEIVERAIERLIELCAAARGRSEKCSVERLEQVPSYVESWIIPELRRLINFQCYHDDRIYVRENEVQRIEQCIRCGEYFTHPRERC